MKSSTSFAAFIPSSVRAVESTLPIWTRDFFESILMRIPSFDAGAAKTAVVEKKQAIKLPIITAMPLWRINDNGLFIVLFFLHIGIFSILIGALFVA
jgi:hypothetical protein